MGQGDKSGRLGGSRQRGQRKKQRDVRASGGRLRKGKLKGWRSQLGRRGVARRGLWTRADLGSAARQLRDPAVPPPQVAVPASPRPGEQRPLSHGNKCTQGIRHRTRRAEDLGKC